MTPKQRLAGLEACEKKLLGENTGYNPEYIVKSLLWLDLARAVILTKDTLSQLFKV